MREELRAAGLAADKGGTSTRPLEFAGTTIDWHKYLSSIFLVFILSPQQHHFGFVLYVHIFTHICIYQQLFVSEIMTATSDITHQHQ